MEFNTENNSNIEQTEQTKERQHFLNTPERFKETAKILYPDLAAETETDEINELDEEEETKEPKEPKESNESKGIPEEYRFDMPDGFVVNEANIEKISTTFKEMNLTNDQAQKLVNMEAEYIQELMQSQTDEYNNTIKDWEQQSIKELGPNYKDEITHGKKFRDTFFSKETVQLLDSIGILNHPLVVKDFVNGGKKLTKNRLVNESPINQQRTAASVLYPDYK